MAWILGIDEAGYGPNLGPFVMSAVACQVPCERARSCLWEMLQPAVRRGGDRRKKDDRLLVDDSKVVYAGPRGLGALERGLFGLFGAADLTLDDLLQRLCPEERDDVRGEVWYTGRTALPADSDANELQRLRGQVQQACTAAGVSSWLVHSTIVCPAHFNNLVERAGSKGAVLAYSFIRLLQRGLAGTAGSEELLVFIDKQGGRNSYAAQIQQALPCGIVVPGEEAMLKSAYEVRGLGRDLHLAFQPRADQEHFCVAAASMVSKYLRELLMGELNRFWQQHVPGLKATAGYPGDAMRFLEAIRPAAATLKVPEVAIWRQK
jgi:ribonuclease HII